ncbi:MAG: metal ABC transporter permease [Chlamydiales bacterium]|nr:metal ABC transporter permease [Chlamydiales bacterium]
MSNPYWNKDFFEFFSVLFGRLGRWLTFDSSVGPLASDEIQLLVLVAIAVSSALVGTFLVLRRMTMLANSLSHTILLGIVSAFLICSQAITTEGFSLPILLGASLITGLVTTVLTQILTHLMRLQEDASIGLVFNTLFALGILFVTLFTRNVHLGVEAIMGNIDALHVDDLKLVFSVGLITLITVVCFFKQFTLVSFDSAHARTLGFSPLFYTYFLMVLVSATSIGAFRAVGVLLFLAFLVGPVLTARLFTDRLPKLILIAALIGSLSSLISIALARHLLSCYHLPLSTAGLVVTMIGLIYLLAVLFAPERGLITQWVVKSRWKKRVEEMQRT